MGASTEELQGLSSKELWAPADGESGRRTRFAPEASLRVANWAVRCSRRPCRGMPKMMDGGGGLLECSQGS